MRKFLFIFFSVLFFNVSFSYAQEWTTSKDLKNPVNNKSISEYIFDGSTYKVKISPIFTDMMLIETTEPIGKIRFNRFRHVMSAKISIFLYDLYGRKIWRNTDNVIMGYPGMNNKYNIASIRCKKLYDHIMNNTGYAVINYISLISGETIQLQIPCIH